MLLEIREKAMNAVLIEDRPSSDDKGALYEMEYWNVLLTKHFAQKLAAWYKETETTTRGLLVFDKRKYLFSL